MSIERWTGGRPLGKPNIESGQARIYFLPPDNPTWALKKLKNPERIGRVASEI